MSRNKTIEIVSPKFGVSPDFLSAIIEAPPEVKARIESYLQSSSDNDITYTPTSQDTPFPVRSVPDPKRREELVIAELEYSPDQEYVERVRSVRTSRGSIDPKTWLTEQYINGDGQVVCQICQEEMPFKRYDGNHYFDAVEMLKDFFTKEYASQFLALCPGCSPKYRTYVKQVPKAMNALKENLSNADNSGDFVVPVKLGDKETSIRFVERHWIDIKAILSFYAQQETQDVENSVPDLNRQDQQIVVSQSSQWSGDKTAREVVRDAVRELTQDKTDVEFTIKDVISVIHKTDPTFKNSTAGAQITAVCVNHPSRKHHPSYKQNYYWRVEKGKYRLIDPEKDKIEDLDDSIQT